MTREIKAEDIRPGMVVDIYGGTERIAVTGAKANGYGAVIISDGFEFRGLSLRETVTLVGLFNP